MNVESKFYSVWNFLSDVIIIGLIVLASWLFIIPIGASVSAMYYVYMKLVNENSKPINERKKLSIYKDFYKSFKENFRQSTICLVIISIFAVILYFYYTIIPSDVILIRLIIYLATYQLLIFSMYIFAIISKFKDSTLILIKNAILMANKHLKTTILMILSLLGVIILVVYVHTFFILLSVAIYGISTAYHLNRIFKLYIDTSEEL